MSIIYRGHVFNSGDAVECYITPQYYVQGTIHIHAQGHQAWICHDQPNKSGDRSPELYGHSHSWTFRFINSECCSDDIIDLRPSTGLPSKQILFDSILKDYLHSILESNIFSQYFRYKVKPFEDFNQYALSQKPGFIVLSGEVKTRNGIFPKTVEIKFSRYLKQLAVSYKKLFKENKVAEDYSITDSQVEQFYNKFVSIQNGDYFQLEMLSSQDILSGYTSANYNNSKVGTLHKSCMTDKFSYLALYCNNSNCRLAVLKSDKGIEARCLVWTDEEGQSYFDRIYYSSDWIENVLEKKMKALNFINVYRTKDIVRIRLENQKFEHYPYLDSFMYQHRKAGCRKHFYATPSTDLLPSGLYRRYQRTGGDWANFRVVKDE